MCYRMCRGGRFALAVILLFVLASAAMVSAVSDAGAATIRPAREELPAAAATSIIQGATCPDVMVIAARGAGEAPSDWTDPAAYNNSQNYYGAGNTLYTLYQELKNGSSLNFSLYPVFYPARPIFRFSPPYLSPTVYSGGEARTGAQSIINDITTTDAMCNNTVRYILAGYSLGAWAVHDALNQLSATQLGEIAGVALFGDPKFQPGQPIVRDFNSQDTHYGISYLVDSAYNNIPSAVTTRTGSWCVPTDPICQAYPGINWAKEIFNCGRAVSTRPPNAQLCAHLQYPTDGETAKAAAFLSPFLPAGGGGGGGAGWTAAKAPLPADAGMNPYPFLTSVKCVSASSCVAVGGYDDFSTNGQGLLETLSGTTWTPTRAPLPANAAANPQAGFQSVACTSMSSCLAVGTYQDSSGNYQGLLETFSGTTWTATEAPLPANAASACSQGCRTQLTSVTCTSATSCVAVGSYEVPGQSSGGLALFDGLVETLSGTTWTATEAPLPAGAASNQTAFVLWSVACVSASSCLAVGQYQDSSGNQQGLVETLSGTTWTATEAALPAGAAASQTADLVSVVCPSTSSCVAVGFYADSSGSSQGLLETLSGTTWTATEAPVTTAHSQADLVSVACASASSCAAAGEYRDSSGNRQGLLDTLSGTTWTATEAPVPAGAFVDPNANLVSVACPSATSCVAVGAYTSSSGGAEGLLETLSGTTWTATEAPLPPGASQTAGPVSVACPSVSSCVAVGYYTDSSGNIEGLLLTGPG